MTLERRGDSLDPALRNEMLEHIVSAASRMHSALCQLVDYARMDIGAMELTPAVVDLSEAVREAASSVSEQYPDSEIDVAAPESIKAFTDAERLGQILSAVVENAVRHGKGRARVSVDLLGTAAIVRVEDAGEGVPESLENLIFSADLGARPRLRQPRGLGIALHNARRILRLQGGDLDLAAPRASGDYPGAVFEISLGTPDTEEICSGRVGTEASEAQPSGMGE